MKKNVFLSTMVAGVACVAAAAQTPATTPPAPAGGRTDVPKSSPPPPAAVRPFNFPKYETKKLANGLTVFVVEDHRLPVVSYRLEIASAGTSATELKQAGLASMTAELLRQGTKTRNAQQIAATVDRVGVSLGANAMLDTTMVRATASKSAAPVALDAMADIVLNPVFPQEELDRLTRQTLSGLQVQYSNPQALAGMVGPRVAYGTHAYGIPGSGTPESIRGLKRDQVLSFYNKNYGPAASYLAISGDVTPAEAFASAEKAFGSWKGSAVMPTLAEPKVSSARQIIVVDKPDAVQTQLRMNQVAVRRADPDFVPLLIANQIFGGDFNSRLNMKLRANEGLTYGANSGFSAMARGGMFNVSTFTRTEKTGTAVKMMADLLDELLSKPITDAEMSEAKAYLAGSFALSIETPEAVAGRVLSAAVNGLPPDYWQTYRETILGTTKEQVVASLKRRVNPANMSIVAVGNAGQFTKELEPLGKVTVIPVGDLDLTSENLMRAKEAVPMSGEAKTRGLELVKQAAEAMGGKAALDGVKSIETKTTLTVSMGGQTAKLDTENYVVYPNKMRTNIQTPMGAMTQAYDGTVAWMQQGPQTRDITGPMLKEMTVGITRMSGIGLLRDALAGKAEVAALDPVEMDGKKLNPAVWTEGDTTIKLFFDPESKRIARMQYRGVSMQGPADFDLALGDYRKVGDVYLPYTETVFQNGQKFAESATKEAKVNSEVKNELFTKPAA